MAYNPYTSWDRARKRARRLAHKTGKVTQWGWDDTRGKWVIGVRGTLPKHVGSRSSWYDSQEPVPRSAKEARRRGLRGFGALGEVTAKDFRAFASLLCKHGASDALVSDLTDYFGSQNPRFDAARFQKATRTCRCAGARHPPAAATAAYDATIEGQFT
jgi:hypothetical protein